MFLLPSDSFMCPECGRCSMSWKGHVGDDFYVCSDCLHHVEVIQVVISHVDGHEDPQVVISHVDGHEDPIPEEEA